MLDPLLSDRGERGLSVADSRWSNLGMWSARAFVSMLCIMLCIAAARLWIKSLDKVRGSRPTCPGAAQLVRAG
jgi:hypothetical protein